MKKHAVPAERVAFVYLAALGFAILVGLKAPVYGSNPTQLENAKPGATDWQLANPATNHEIEGYASLTSVNRGSWIQLFVNTPAPAYNVDIYRMGWYKGAGARRVMSTLTLSGTAQPQPTPDPTTGLIECHWSNPYTLRVPYPWASGFYLAKLTASQSGKQSYVIFVVRDDARSSDFLFQSSVMTHQAYNGWGGKSLYPFNSSGPKAVKVSFNRPYGPGQNPAAAAGVGAGEFLNNMAPTSENSSAAWEYNMVRFLEREGYDVTYLTDVDTHENGGLLLKHKAFLSVGHDEYWTWQMRTNVEAARDQGINLGFFSSNTCYWQARLEPSVVFGAADRTIVGYKYDALTQDPYAKSPTQAYLTTTLWRRHPVDKPEDSLLGVRYLSNPINGNIVVADASNWIFTYTGLENGSSLPGLLGYEVDGVGPQTPANASVVAHSPFGDNTHFSDMTVYTASSGASVFATGSMQWSWGLDDYDVPSVRPSTLSFAAQQITRNVLSRFSGMPLTPSFFLGSSPDSVSFLTGDSATVSVNLASFGYTPTLTLSTRGLPTGMSAGFSPASVPGAGSSTLTLASSVSVIPGTYAITITASDGNQQKSTSLLVSVTNVIPRSAWTLKFTDSQETVCENGRATNVFDNHPTTNWITQYCGTTARYPHEVQINMGKTYNVAGFSCLPRQDEINGRVSQYDFYVSPDGLSWGSPVASGVFANDATEKQVSFPSARGQFIRFRALSEVNGNPWAAMAEIHAMVGPRPTRRRGFISSP